MPTLLETAMKLKSKNNMKVIFLSGLVFLFLKGLAQSNFKNNTIQNFSRNAFCVNINIIGSGNKVSATIPIEEINQAMKDVLFSITQNERVKQDTLYKNVYALLAQIKNINQPHLLIDQQSRVNDILDTLADKYMQNSAGYNDVKKNIFSNYKEIQPLVCNKEKIRITEINGVRYYLANNIKITNDDITLYRSNGPLSRFKFKNKFGFLNEIGSIVVAPQYDSASDLSDNFAMVFKAGLYWGFIDTTGREIKRFSVEEYDAVYPFSNHFSLIKQKTTCYKPGYYFIDGRWDEKYGPFYYAESFSHGLALVTELNKDSFFLKNIDKIPDSVFNTYGAMLKHINPEFSDRLLKAVSLYRKIKTSWPYSRLKKFGGQLKDWHFSRLDTYIDSIIYVCNFTAGDEDYFYNRYRDSVLIKLFRDVIDFKKTAIPELCESLNSSYINTSGHFIFSDGMVIGRSFEYENVAMVCRLSNEGTGINLFFNLIDGHDHLKNDFQFKSSSFRSYDLNGFPFSYFNNGLAVSEKQVIDSSGNQLTKLTENFFFDGRYENELFVIYTMLAASNSTEKGMISLYTPRTGYGLVNKYGVDVLPTIYKNIELISEVLCKVESFDNKVEYFHINANGKSVPIKTTQ